MRDRITQSLLAAIVVLLVFHLFRSVEVMSTAQAQEVAQTPDVLRARSIELVGANGKVVAQLYVGEDGGGNVRLRSADGTVRVKLGATDNGSGLLLLDRDTEPAVTLGTNATGTSMTLAQKGKAKRVITP